MTNNDFQRDLQAGMQRLQQIEANLEASSLQNVVSTELGRHAPKQPWLIFGCSDGIGLQTTIAALNAGVLKFGLGVYWEPPHLLELDRDGTPVSPVHYARYQNTIALKEYAKKFNATLEILSADCIMAPQRGIKGDIKSEPNPIDPKIVESFQHIREKSELKDAILINSVAFGKWICPREGHDAIEVPSVNFDGEIVMTKTKPYHPRGYQETLDTMGRNHKQLLLTAKKHEWLGPQSLTAFYTWAGGSQNVDVLDGIYGKGSLGDAKAIAEEDTVAFRLEHKLSLGAHAIVRLPAFLSAALMGIPGGGLFGLISRHLLSSKGAFFDMPTLASRTIRRLFGPEWIRSNPIAQIELDMQETLYIEEIKERVTLANQTILDYLHSKKQSTNTLDLETSRQLLQPFVDPHYDNILARFRPSLTADKSSDTQKNVLPTTSSEETEILNKIPPSTSKTSSIPISAEVIAGTEIPQVNSMSDSGDIRPDIPLFETLRHLSNGESPIDFKHYTVIGEDLIVDGLLCDVELTTTFDIRSNGNNLVVYRSIVNERGQQVAKGTLTLGHNHSLLTLDDDLGEPMGHAMPVRKSLNSAYGPNYENDEGNEIQRAALLKFVADQIRSSGGLLDDIGHFRLSARFGKPVEVGQTLQTFAKNGEQSLVVTIIDEKKEPLLRVELRQ